MPSTHHHRLDPIALWIFAGAIPYAALAFGTTTFGTRLALDIVLVLGALLVFVGGVGRPRNPHSLSYLRLLIGLILALLVLGGLHLLNPKYAFQPRLDSVSPVEGAIAFLPGTYDVSRTWPEVLHFACLGLGLIALTILVRSSESRWKMLQVIASTGFIVAAIGIYQKVSGAQSMLWTTREYDPTFFAAFRYHGNAAAYLNLCWPAALAMLVKVIRDDPRNLVAKTWWICCLVFTFGGLLVNTSKYGHLTAFLCLAAGIAIGISRLPRLEGKGRWVGLVTVLLLLGLFAVMSLFSGEQIFAKWDEAMENGVSFKRRLMAYETAIRMWQDAPIWGYGPGCFGLIFRFYSVSAGKELGGKWTFAHNDYLQALTEWGIVGAILIFAIFGVGIFLLFRQVRKSRWSSWTAMAGGLALFLISLHVMVDFSLQIGAMQMIAIVYLSFGWAGAPEHAHRRRQRRRRRRSSRLRDRSPGAERSAGGEPGERSIGT